MADCEGKVGVVQFQVMKNGHVEVFWDNSSSPCRRECMHGQTTQKPFHAWPKKSTANEPSLLGALEQAMQVVGKDPVHRGMNYLRLRGTQGDIVATDGRQLLIQRGYQWPWTEPVLVPRTNVFASSELVAGPPVLVAYAIDHILFRSGPWTIVLPIETSARFPKVDPLIPRADAAITRWIVDPSEASSLALTLSERPAAKEEYAPVTLDLNGAIVIRAKADDQARCTEVPLPGSRCEGQTRHIATDRRYLQRALQLGFNTVYLFE